LQKLCSENEIFPLAKVDIMIFSFSPISNSGKYPCLSQYFISQSILSSVREYTVHKCCYICTDTESTACTRNHDNTNITERDHDNTAEDKKKRTIEGTNKVKNLPPQYEKDETMLSSARVLLIGISADEMTAGYGRFRSMCNKGGYHTLREELKKDKYRLWARNLGHDVMILVYFNTIFLSVL